MLVKKWMLSLGLCLSAWMPIAGAVEYSHYRIDKSDYTFSTVFDITHDKQPMGSVVKSIFHVATQYDLYNRFGLFEGHGACHIFCLGFLYAWGAKIDVFNIDGDKVGLIDGQFFTKEPAKFNFYNEEDTCIAMAFLSSNCMEFCVVDPDNSALVLARLSRNFVEDAVDNWDMVVYHPERIPLSMLKIFSAFACDTQDQFNAEPHK